MKSPIGVLEHKMASIGIFSSRTGVICQPLRIIRALRHSWHLPVASV